MEPPNLVGWGVYGVYTDPRTNQSKYSFPLDKSKPPAALGLSAGSSLWIRKADVETQKNDTESWMEEEQRLKALEQLNRLKSTIPQEEYQRRFNEIFQQLKKGSGCPKNHKLVNTVVQVPSGLSDLQRLIYTELKCAECGAPNTSQQPVWFCDQCVYEICTACRIRLVPPPAVAAPPSPPPPQVPTPPPPIVPPTLPYVQPPPPPPPLLPSPSGPPQMEL
eukprot:PhF_6_TR6909/c0_g1_i1/m.10051